MLQSLQIAKVIRRFIRNKVGGEFHGTWVSGVIAANPKNAQGLVGVAPKAQILPVRVFGLNGSFLNSAFIEAIGYAADRGDLYSCNNHPPLASLHW